MKCKKCGSDWNSASGKVLTKCPFCNADLTEKEDINDSEAVRAIKDILKKYGVSVMSEKARFIGLFGDYAPKLAHEKRILQLALDENTAKFFINCKEAERENNLAKAQNALLEVLNEKTVREILEIFVDAFEWKVKMPQTAQKSISPVANDIKVIIIHDNKFGKGTYTGKTDSSGQPNGNGKAVYNMGVIYDGKWKNGKRNGKGIEIFEKSGRVFEGEWKNNELKDGKITYANGDVYEGGLKYHFPNGIGRMTYANGTVKSGRWEAGVFKG